MTAVPDWLLSEMPPGALRAALRLAARGCPFRDSVAISLGFTPEELDVYEAGREIGDADVLHLIHAMRTATREPGGDDV